MNEAKLQSWWLEHLCGQQVLAQIQDQLAHLVGHERYEHVLQLGLPDIDFLPNAHIKHRHIVGPESCPILAQWAYLPLATESMDLVIVPLVLSQHPNRHAILREAQRVLCGYGKLIVLDLNPYSLWRVQGQRLKQLTGCDHSHSMTPKRVMDWFQLLDLQPQDSRFIGYRPLCQQPKQWQKWSFLEPAGNRWWPHAAALYAMLAVKQVVYLRPLSPHASHQRRPEMALNPVSIRKPEQ